MVGNECIHLNLIKLSFNNSSDFTAIIKDLSTSYTYITNNRGKYNVNLYTSFCLFSNFYTNNTIISQFVL